MRAYNVQEHPYAAPCGSCSPERRNDPPLVGGAAGAVSYPGGMTRMNTCRGTAPLVTRRLPHVLRTAPTHFSMRHLHSNVARARPLRHPSFGEASSPEDPPSTVPAAIFIHGFEWFRAETYARLLLLGVFEVPWGPPSGRTYSS